MIPSIGRTVHYALNEQDAIAINRRRKDAAESGVAGEKSGAQVHIGNRAEAGQIYPMVIVRVWGDTETSSVNGQVMLDGNDTLWVTSRAQGINNGQWSPPMPV